MARKKAPPKRAPEYEAPKKKGFAKRTGGPPGQGKRKQPVGKAKDGSKCYTRKNSSGGSYTTCEGKQQSNKRLAKEISSLSKTSDKLQARTAQKAKKSKPKVSKAEFNQARSNLTKTMARKPGTKPRAKRSVGSYADSDATRRSTRPVGEGGFAKRTGGAPGKFTSNPTGNKPHGMSMDEWRTRPSYREAGYAGPTAGQSEAGAIHEFLGV
tara:strand:- start:66 stop:698 length:633 start_codon:yes stop_codon:yes gene_type:complete